MSDPYIADQLEQHIALPRNIVTAFLENAGSIEMDVDGSATPVEFDYVVTHNLFDWYKSNFIIYDGGIVADGFGGLAALTNGLLLQIYDTDGSTLLHDFTADFAIHRHGDLALLAMRNSVIDTTGAGDDRITGEGIMRDSLGGPIRLAKGQIIRATVQDNLTGLTQFRMLMQGYGY